LTLTLNFGFDNDSHFWNWPHTGAFVFQNTSCFYLLLSRQKNLILNLDESTDTVQQLSVVNTKAQMKEKDIITMNGDHRHVTELKASGEGRPRGESGSTTPGEQTNRVGHLSPSREHRTNRNRRMMSGDHVTSETDSEEEFCDTSDQPSQV
jgi:hypothetical protein